MSSKNCRCVVARLASLSVVAAIALAAGGCGLLEGGGGGGDGDTGEEMQLFEEVDADTCKSERKWTAGQTGSPLMHPGRDCVDCHSQMSGAPEFSIAGTVYAGFRQQDECAGVEGAEVVVTGDDGETVELETNEAGNFYLMAGETELESPMRTEVNYEGETREMMDNLYETNCANCHTAERTGARKPGRIVIPGIEPG